jgi:prolyl oligopeptidase
VRVPIPVLLSSLAMCAVSAAAAVPAPEPHPVTDEYFGTRVVDPYRWLEDVGSPATKDYLEAQDGITRAVLQQLAVPRDELLTRLQQLDHGVDRVPIPASYEARTVMPAGGSVFYKKLRAGAAVAGLYVRGYHGQDERELVDPSRFASRGKTASIAYFSPSPDGRYVAFGISEGDERIWIHVIHTDDGALLPEKIPDTTAANLDWADATHLLYVRPADTGGQVAAYERASAYLHKLGDDYTHDRRLFGYGYSAAIPFSAHDFAYLVHPAGSGYLVAVMTYGDQYDHKVLYAAPLGDVLRRRAPVWRRMTDPGDAVDDFEVHGMTAFVLTHKHSSNREIRAFSLVDGGFGNSIQRVPASGRVISALAAAGDALYVTDLDGGTNRLRRHGYGPGAGTAEVPLPYAGAVTVTTRPDEPGALVSETSWIHSGAWFSLTADGRFADTGLQPPDPADFSQVIAEEVTVPSTGGVRVPLSIVHLRGIHLDGSHPLWLEGYGAYGGALQPSFDAGLLAWLERGGVYAVAHVRGGGEYGERWHLDGMLERKQHGVDDFLACADWLVRTGYSSPSHMAAVGASAGGLLVGDAITQRPEAFAAALDIVGLSDLLRFMRSPNGRFNAREFGDIDTPARFQALYAVDPYQHVRAGVSYPAVLLTGGIHDSRIPVWEPAKMAARLQAASVSGKPVLLYVDQAGGHGLTASQGEAEKRRADWYSFLLWQLGDPGFQPH